MQILRLCFVFPIFASLLVVYVASQDADQQQIRSCEQAIAAAEGRNDAAPFKRILANDWMVIAPDGNVRHKDETVQDFLDHQNETRPYVVTLEDLRVDVFGNTAVATFTREYHGRIGEAKGKVMRGSVVDVFTKANGEWKLRFSKPMPVLPDNRAM
jgi:ketosteroid isomerase-like protein